MKAEELSRPVFILILDFMTFACCNIFESHCKGAHTMGNSKSAFPGVSNSNTIGIAILGDFTSKLFFI